MNQKNAIFVIIGIFLDKAFKYEPYLCNGCHDLMHFWYMSKDDAINIMNNSHLNEKSGLL